MCLKGGFGFHVAEIAVRFGPDVLTYFFKVSQLMLTLNQKQYHLQYYSQFWPSVSYGTPQHVSASFPFYSCT